MSHPVITSMIKLVVSLSHYFTVIMIIFFFYHLLISTSVNLVALLMPLEPPVSSQWAESQLKHRGT